MDLDELEQAAKKATQDYPGPWFVRLGGSSLWDYISLANPDTVLKLIAVARAAPKALKQLVEAMADMRGAWAGRVQKPLPREAEESERLALDVGKALRRALDALEEK